MMRARLLALLLVTSALFAAPALGQQAAEGAPPTGARVVLVGNATLAYWVGPDALTVDEDLAAGEAGSLWFTLAGTTTNASSLVAFLNLTATSANLTFSTSSLTLEAATNASDIRNVTFTATPGEIGRTNFTYSFEGEIYENTNGTLALVGPVAGSGAFTVEAPAPTLPPGAPALPIVWIVGAAAVLIVVGGGFALRQRSVRRRMNEAPRRSQVMRELELEQKMTKAKDPEQVAEIKQEIRASEQVREKRREVQILEAKRADAHKTLDLLKKRHESGGLTKFQYDSMVGKKQADLAKIEADIAAMEREDAGSAA